MYQSGGQLRGRAEESPRPLSSLRCRLGNRLRDAAPPPRPLVATSRQGFGPEFGSDFWVTLVEVRSSPWDIVLLIWRPLFQNEFLSVFKRWKPSTSVCKFESALVYHSLIFCSKVSL